ncbi:MAG: OmpH family outer membrane protein [Cyclobacteriaceae bacterium]|nr:OmpH family outer membrane protein [Cyclobacteriaceae bacterium]
MNKNTLVFRIVMGAITTMLVASVIFLFLDAKKVVYVTSYKLVEGYTGTIEARREFEKKRDAMMGNVDSLKIAFEQARLAYMQSVQKLNAEQRMEKEQRLVQQQTQLAQYSQAVDQKIREEDSEMMQEVLNQINSFVEDYAVSNGYDIVLGTTSSGSLLYGKKSMDITDPLLEALNNYYSGHKK